MSRERIRKELSPEELLELEVSMHRSFEPWTLAHSSEDGSSISYLGYDPDRYPEQRITEYVTPAKLPELPFGLETRLPDSAIMFGLREIVLAKTLGGRAVARQIVKDFKETPAYPDQPNSPGVANEVARLLDDGKNVAMIVAHKYRPDVGIGLGAEAVAMGKTRYIYENNWQIINKLMTAQEYQGKSLTEKTRGVGRIAWVIPPGKSTSLYDVPRRAMIEVGRGSGEVLEEALDDPRTGVNLAVAPTKAGMLPVKNEAGEVVGWRFPEIEGAAQTMLDPMDAALPFAFNKDVAGKVSWQVGNLITPPEMPGLSQSENSKLYMDLVMLDLKTKMEELLGKPVEYNPLIAAGLGSIALRQAI